MRPFLAVAAFEMRDKMRRISTHVYFGLFFALTALFTAAIGGAFTGGAVGVMGGGGNVHTNGPWMIAIACAFPMMIATLLVPAIMGNAVYRDFAAGIHPLVFTTPVPKWAYFLGRYAGAALATAWVLASIPVAHLLTCLLPKMDQEHLGPVSWGAYAATYLVLVLPLVLVVGAPFFGFAALSRTMLPNYLGGALVLVGYIGASILQGNPENKELAALLDPFGLTAYGVVTEYWTPAEKNSLLPPVAGLLGWNRLAWCALGLALLVVSGWRFRFRHAQGSLLDRFRRPRAPEAEGAGLRPGMRLTLPDVLIRHDGRAHLAQLWSSLRRSLSTVVLNVYFVAITVIGLLFLLIFATEVGKMYGTATWPVTYRVLEVLGGSFGLFVLIVLTFFAGELTWQERDLRLSQVADATPAPTWTSVLGKLGALWTVVALMLLLMVPAGMATQLAYGYTRFEPLLYFQVLLGLRLPTFMLFAVLALLVQALVNHKYAGHLVVVLVYLAPLATGWIGWEHQLLQYASDTGFEYSDMNRFGPFLSGVFWFKLFWIAIATVLLVLTHALWVRGQESGLRERLRLARARFSGPGVAAAAAALLVGLGAGAWILYNTNVLNEYATSKEGRELQAEYERKYRQYLDLPQPRVTAVSAHADIFPGEGRIRFTGTYDLVNKTQSPITDLHVLLGGEPDEMTITFEPPATLELDDEEIGYRIWKLETPLAPGAPLRCRFDLTYRRKGFSNSGPDLTVVENGTFVNSSLLPSFGYFEGAELSDDDARRKEGLEPRPRMRPITDEAARLNTYIARDADWVDFEASACTEPDQIAIAPGYLQREWEQDGRRCFAYAMDAPILNFWSILSARYEVEKDAWTAPDGTQVAIEVYHHPTHDRNVERMIEGVKKSLDYYTVAFGPYQHRQVRILEFPRYATFAQSFPNTIPYSESIGFIARVKDQDDVDYPFYVTAHEVAHQWFAHQVIGANVQGSTVLSESLSQYAALMVMEKEYGREHMRRFLSHELHGYLTGRSLERKAEQPLALNENQQYIHYQKGSLVFYALREWLGEDGVNLAIRNHLAKVKWQEPPYTTSLELLDEIRAVAPPELHAFVDDLFLHVTLWDLRMKEARVTRREDGRFDVAMAWEATQLRADEKGVETEVPLDLAIPVGVFAEGPSSEPEDDEPLWMERVPVRTGPGTLTVTVDRQPARAGIDPWHYLVDRNPGDNLVKVEDAEPPAS